MVSRILSLAGLFSLILAIGFMFGPDASGETVFRWDRLLLGLGVGIACFVGAAKFHKPGQSTTDKG